MLRLFFVGVNNGLTLGIVCTSHYRQGKSEHAVISDANQNICDEERTMIINNVDEDENSNDDDDDDHVSLVYDDDDDDDDDEWIYK